MNAPSSLRFLLIVLVCLLTTHRLGQAQDSPVVISGDLVIKGNVVIEGDVTINGDLKVNGRIIPDGDGTVDPGENGSDKNIFVRLWKLDQRKGGLSVTLREENGNWADESADIRLDEQKKNSGRLSDGAPDSMLTIHDRSKLDGPTWEAVRKLFDNYELVEGNPEDQLGTNPEEDAEIDEFLNAVLATDVIKLSLKHINQLDWHGEDEDLTVDEFKDMLKKQWFQTYSNHFRGNTVHHANGFEHVFVGEHDTRDIGGYHFWWKFALDHAAGEAESLGHNYKPRQGPTPDGQKYPWLATFRMLWEPGGDLQLREPDKKGFFVGASPELMMAYGTLSLLFEKQNGGAHPVVTLDGGTFELVVHANTLPSGERGDKIRSSFPILKSLGTSPVPAPADIIDVEDAFETSEGTDIAVRGMILYWFSGTLS